MGAAIFMTMHSDGNFERVLVHTQSEPHRLLLGQFPIMVPLRNTCGSFSLQVLRRLDNIDEGVRQFFLPASKLVLESGDPEDALSRALAALSGLMEVPKPRRQASRDTCD
jgi:hypothetical protein